MSTASEIASALGGTPSGPGWAARCPAHDDDQPSLSINEGDDGKVLVHCHAGCPQEAVIEALRSRGLSLDGRSGSSRRRLPARRIIDTYDYRDENGAIIYQVVRRHPKEFHQRRPDGKRGWIEDIEGVTRLPYCLPQMLALHDVPVYVVEGEKDVDRLRLEGLVATTNSGGAGASMSWPEIARWFAGRRVFILPDNDGPGRRHAGAIARALNGIAQRVKIVELPNLPAKGDVSDWLDAGNTVRQLRRLAHDAPTWTPGAADPEPTADEAEIARLAALPRIEYERARKQSGKQLGIRVTPLDKMVQDKREELRPKAEETDATGTGRPVELPEIPPWNQQVAGLELLAELASTIRRYVILEQYQVDAVALWVVFTHAFDAFEIAAKLSIKSAEMRSGKSRLIGVLQRLVRRPLPTSGISPAALLRVIELQRPTLLLDEFDTQMRAGAEVAETLRGLLNSSFNKATATFIKNEPVPGGSWAPHQFSTWCPQVLAGIGELPGTVADRSIPIQMKRKFTSEKVARLRDKDGDDLRLLARKAARWAADHLRELEQADPSTPPQLDDRTADAWSSSFAIADVAGGEWPDRARHAALTLMATNEEDVGSIRTMLLGDLRDVFEKEAAEYMTAEGIIDQLVKINDHPWGELARGKPITAHRLAGLLRPFNIRTRQTRIDGRNVKAYRHHDLADAFERYLSADPALSALQTAASLHPDVSAAFPRFRTAAPAQDAAVQNAEKVSVPAACSDAAVCSAGERPVRDKAWWREAIKHSRRLDEEKRKLMH